MKLNFCFLSYASPELRVAGGTTHFIQNLSRWCAANQGICVWTTKDAAHLINQLGDKCTIRCIGSGTASLTKSNMGVSISLMLRILQSLVNLDSRNRDRKAELIVTESHFLPDIIAAIALRRHYPNATLVTYLHHITPSPGNRTYHPLLPSTLAWLAQTLSLSLMKKWNFHILTFPFVKTELVRLGFSEERIHCINNGVDTDYIKATHASEGRYDACFLGNALPRKGIFDLPGIWSEVCREFPHARLAIMGTGTKNHIDGLRQSFISKGLERNVSFLGYLPERDKIATLKASRIFLFPSYEEGWGIAIAEAMACGLPVVAYDLPAYQHIFKRGMVKAPVGSVGTFAKITISLLRDEAGRIVLGDQGSKQASEFSVDRIAEAELSLLRKIAGKGSSACGPTMQL